MKQQLPYSALPGSKRGISCEFGAVEARDAPELVPKPYELLGRVESHGGGRRGNGIVPRGREEQTPDLE